jgi:hypothetical protein
MKERARSCRMAIARLLERFPRFLRVVSPLATPGEGAPKRIARDDDDDDDLVSRSVAGWTVAGELIMNRPGSFVRL